MEKEYLIFKRENKRNVSIWDKEERYLGKLEKIRVGAWMSFVLTDIPDEDVYFSAGCLDEIREKVKELNSNKKGN